MIYFLVSILLFLKCGYPLIVKEIKEIVQSKKANKNQIQKTSNTKNSRKSTSRNKTNIIKKKKGHAPPKKLNNKKEINLNISKNIGSNSKFIFNNNIQNNRGNFLLPGQNNNRSVIRNNKKLNSTRIPVRRNINNNIFKRRSINLINAKKTKNKKSAQYNHFDLNTLEYINAINFDKRTFCQYYLALIRIKHPLLFGLCPMKDYNSMIIKLCIFLLSFDMYYVINFIFFDEMLFMYYMKTEENSILFISYLQLQFLLGLLILLLL